MNYLGHAYLSFEHPEVLTGNLISDFVKGKKKYDYVPGILAGINMHREIDAFTDEHSVTKTAKEIFRPAYGLYASAFMDVMYDHFLAVELAASGADLFLDFTKRVYASVETFEPVFPDKFRQQFPYMKKHNWLFNYQFDWGIARSLEGLVHRAVYIQESETAFKLFNRHYGVLKSQYTEFFPQLKQYALELFLHMPGKYNFNI